MFVCAFHPEISSFFRYEFPLSFLFFKTYTIVRDSIMLTSIPLSYGNTNDIWFQFVSKMRLPIYLIKYKNQCNLPVLNFIFLRKEDVISTLIKQKRLHVILQRFIYERNSNSLNYHNSNAKGRSLWKIIINFSFVTHDPTL